MTFENAAITKRQSQNECECKNGAPGPRGPPGLKGGIGKKDVKVMLVLLGREVMLEIEDQED